MILKFYYNIELFCSTVFHLKVYKIARCYKHLQAADKPHHIKVDYQFAQNKEAPLCKWEMICKQIEQSD